MPLQNDSIKQDNFSQYYNGTHPLSQYTFQKQETVICTRSRRIIKQIKLKRTIRPTIQTLYKQEQLHCECSTSCTIQIKLKKRCNANARNRSQLYNVKKILRKNKFEQLLLSLSRIHNSKSIMTPLLNIYIQLDYQLVTSFCVIYIFFFLALLKLKNILYQHFNHLKTKYHANNEDYKGSRLQFELLAFPRKDDKKKIQIKYRKQDNQLSTMTYLTIEIVKTRAMIENQLNYNSNQQ
ncbi:unnamed protein product [Paramecium octaurelia]|uniref:Transmembrane protein n=1 Tax=Paramecium octaurelia TaxID=43137 RepID=A0A8S1W6J9_PAROT|nr:unnamed protein product [Paramecium octaurelia]